MTPDEFRALALALPDSVEGAHMGHADFRVGGKIFATLGYPDAEHGALMLSPEEQAALLRSHAHAFAPANGAWGERGSTTVQLRAIDIDTARAALLAAWRKRAPKRVITEFERVNGPAA